MSFAFTAVRPETQGQDTDMEVPMSDYLSASFEQGWGGTLGKIHDFGKYLAEASDETSPMLTPEQLNRDYPVAEPWTAPARESVAMLLKDKHEEELRRSFYLQNDNHSFVAGAMGMGTSMVASLLNPVDLALVFVPVVGPGARLGPVTEAQMAAGALGRVGRFREALNTGILTTRGELAAATRFPYMAENVIQNAGFAVTAEGINQVVADHYKQDAGNPLLNVVSNVALGATIHGAVNILGKIWHSLPSSLKEEMMVKAMDDFVKGKDIQVDEHLRTAEVFAKYQVMAQEAWMDSLMSHTDAPLKQEPLNIEAFQKKIQGIYSEALAKLRADLLPKGEKPIVPTTEAVPEQVAFTSVLDEIRQKNARTKEQIQKIYPQLTREEAAVLRRQAWNEQEVKAQHEQNLSELFDKAKERNANKQMGAKRLARITAERNMPNPIPEAQLTEAVHEVVVPADSTIAKVEEGAKKAEKKVKAKEPKPKKEKPVLPVQEKAKAIGLTPMKGALGKKGYFTTTDPRFKGLSVILNDEGIHLNSIEVADAPTDLTPEVLPLEKGYKAEIDPKLGNIRIVNAKGIGVGRIVTEELSPTMLGIEISHIDDEARGNGFGQKTLTQLAKRTGKILVSDQHPSANAAKMWTRMGAKLEKVQIADEIQNRYVYRAEVMGKGKGAGTEMLNKLKALADEMDKPITLTAEALDKASQAKLEAWYEKNGFTRVKGNEFIYEPKMYVSFDPKQITKKANSLEAKLSEDDAMDIVTPERITGKYEPAVRNKAGKVFTKKDVSKEAIAKELKETGYGHVHHLMITENLKKEDAIGLQSGFVDKQGKFYTLLEAAREEMKIQELEAKLKAEGEAKIKQLIEEAKPRPDIIQAATDCIIKNIL
jgi:hypothetical protein